MGLIVPRQNGKGGELEAIELAGLFLFDEELIMHSAHEFKTAAEAYLRIKGLIENTPDLDRLVNRYHNAHGSEGIELTTGARLRFVARTGGSGRGFSGDRIILDEAYNLSDRSMSALAYTMAARPNPQIMYTSSGPPEGETASHVLRRLMKRGRAGAPGLTYIEYCADDDADLDDREAWAQANPGYPHRITEEAIIAERGMTLPADFARERLGIVNLDEDTSEWVIPSEHWQACADPTSVIDEKSPTSFALEIAADRSWSTFAVAGRSGDNTQGEIAANREGTGWVVEWAKQRGITVAIRKGSPAASMIEELRAAGVTVVEVTTEEYAKFCGQIYDMAVGHRFRHRSEGALDMAVRKAVKRAYSDSFIWDARRSSIDISPWGAVTIAVGRLSTPTVESVYEGRGMVAL